MKSIFQRRPRSALTVDSIQKCLSHAYCLKQRPKSSNEISTNRSCEKLGYGHNGSMYSYQNDPNQLLLYLSEEEDDQTTDPSMSEYYVPTPNDKLSSGSSNTLSPALRSEEDACFEMYTPDDFDLKSNVGGFNFDSPGCHFGKVPMKYALKRLNFNLTDKACKCTDNILAGWNSPCQERCYARKSQKKGKPMSFFQVSKLNNRIYGCPEKDIKYQFHHYEDSSSHIQQYRKCHTYGSKETSATDADEEVMCVKSYPENIQYVSKVKNNGCSIAENCDFYTVLAIDKDGSDSLCDMDLVEDSVRNFSVKDRGKDLNLAPIRSQKSSNKKHKYKKKPYVSFNQYLNLVIPKSTLHKTNLTLNLEPPKEPSTPKFESKRNPLKSNDHRHSTENQKHKSNPHNVDATTKSPCGGNRASDLRIARANTCIHGINVTKETGITIPQSKTDSPRLHSYKMRSNKLRNSTPGNRSYESERIKECGDHFPVIMDGNGKTNIPKHDDLFPASRHHTTFDSMCRSEDQMTIVYRLRKERERTMRVSMVK